MEIPTRPTDTPSIAALDRMPSEEFVAAIAPLFESATRFLGRLVAARPFGSAEELFRRAREIALVMPEDDQIELVDAHPRLGAPAGSVSAMSYLEQGYDRAAADAAAEAERREVDGRLDRLNVAYEKRFGFRFCVFVAGRTRSSLLPVFEVALLADRRSELRRGVIAAVDIAADRYRRLRAAGETPA